MTIADSSLTDVAGCHASKLGARPVKNTELDQVVVLIRLQYLTPGSKFPNSNGSQCARTEGSPETQVSRPSSSPTAPRASEAVEESESLAPKWFAGISTRVADSRRHLAGIRLSPLIWKATGFAAAVVLILSALLLLRGGAPSGNAVATRDRGEVSFPIAPLAGEPGDDLAAMPERKTPLSVEKQIVTSREQPVAEPERHLSDGAIEERANEEEEVMPEEALPLTHPERNLSDGAIEEQANEDEAVTPEEALPLTHPEADPEPLTSSGSASAEAANDDSTRTQAQANPNQPNYPVTNPSTYRYPLRYEQLLINALHGFHEENYPSSNPSTGIYRWQPNTVRLQPRIEPPPIR